MEKLKTRFVPACVCVFLLGSLAGGASFQENAARKSAGADVPSLPDQSAAAKLEGAYGRIPLQFIPNAGQVDGPAAFYIQGRDKTIYFAPEGLTFVLSGPPESTFERSDRMINAAEPGMRKSRTLGVGGPGSSVFGAEQILSLIHI